ncbi:protein of unknown function [Aureimonas altamirensis DSM 21988]|uniref:DUF3597 domain-containing protein n=1 Tax=Aureimonas altamirensis DSM 21988 TaxID=1121026 RepID=A0ABY1I3T4_9HYPH|nr:DUF3597 domain-containing protein [Aureimonas altamirensis]SHI56678.1 protein of unknown function [Aureimonas altamirensis DSM 21988]
MGIFDRIKNAIWGEAEAAEPAATAEPTATPTAQPTTAPATPSAPSPSTTAQAAPAPTPSAPSASTAGSAEVDIGAVLDNAVSKSGQSLNWKTSIVDLMKALGLDSSLSSRKELAQELGYTGDTDDSATMNIWLHKQVIQKLKANGGKVPADLS